MSGGRYPSSQSSGSEASSLLFQRVVDQGFRRWLLYLLPVVLMLGVGVRAAQAKTPEFQSAGRMSATSNPLVEETEVRGSEIRLFESPAAGTARLINEQLSTDVFVDDVAERAGLTEFIEIGLIDRDVIRRQVGASESGENVLTVGASWGDAETSYLLVDATINGYLDYVESIVVQDSDDAIEFWTAVRDDAEARVAAAETALVSLLDSLPTVREGAERAIEDQLVIQRFNDAVTLAESNVTDAQTAIEQAELSKIQLRSEAGRQLRIIDQPNVPFAPESNMMDRLLLVVVFTMLGVIISIAAMVAATLLDRSVRLPAQLRSVGADDTIVVLPKMKSIRDLPSQSESA